MAIPKQGDKFPDFTIGDLDTKSARERAPLLVLIWRIGCSTSRLSLPFFDRIQRFYPQARVIGICQDSAEEMDAYLAENGIEMRNFADVDLRVTRQLGVDMVPSYWLTDEKGDVIEGGIGWDRIKVEGIANLIAAQTGATRQLLIRAEDNAPTYKPG